ncbi:DUF2188 domain-containing protein [Cyclobacterium sp.]|uniref:DUF2188 domain-containing protein n=1 Tax=Cyclobacterium sp. TaxID=1966343 RepID=UPI001992B863|nr:DUF2188 domain-containing protein [Cyclobacterium sp.]MBD3627535.1 DUF2188 domain-containing protein [Cyclobacterium sp.]
MARKSNHVIPSKDHGWSVRKSGAARALRSFGTKEEAVKYGKTISRGEKTELYIHKKDGTVQNRNSYVNEPITPMDKKG